MSPNRYVVAKTPPKKGSANPAVRSLVTVDDIRGFSAIFSQMLKDTKLGAWVILAGVGGICEVLRMGWDATVYVLRCCGHPLP
jgi:hypothetical protein